MITTMIDLEHISFDLDLRHASIAKYLMQWILFLQINQLI